MLTHSPMDWLMCTVPEQINKWNEKNEITDLKRCETVLCISTHILIIHKGLFVLFWSQKPFSLLLLMTIGHVKPNVWAGKASYWELEGHPVTNASLSCVCWWAFTDQMPQIQISAARSMSYCTCFAYICSNLIYMHCSHYLTLCRL